MSQVRRGFTIIELLVVIAIIGIMAAFSIPNILRSRDVTRVREVQSQIARDIEKAKFLTRRHSYNYTLTFNSTGYVFSPRTGATAEAVTITRTLPSDIQFVNTPASVTLTAPFGKIDASNPGPTGADPWIFIRTISSGVRTGIDMIGVTGIVVRRGIL